MMEERQRDHAVTCRLCKKQGATFLQKGRLRDLTVDYFECPHCGYVQTETPYWLDLAYAEAINNSDTGIMMRNQANARIVLATMLMLKKLDGRLVDCAGGYGILVRLLRDYGVDALWSDRYCENLLAKGFEHADEPADLVTAFEAFEHFEDPAAELDKLLAIAPSVLLSTEIIADPAPKQDDWWYYGKEHGQHIGFFRIRTLQKLAADRGKVLLSDGRGYHLITDKNISPSIWRFLIRRNNMVPFFVRRMLTSKAWSDHIQLAA